MSFYIDIERSDNITTFLCAGDSITYGRNVNGGYRLPFQGLLRNLGIPFNFIGSQIANSDGMSYPNHEGYPSNRIEQISGYVLAMSASPAPDVILLDAGTNDLFQQYDLANINSRLDTFIAAIQNKWTGVQILVATVGPYTGTIHPESHQMNVDSIPFNAHIMALTNVIPVPMNVALQIDMLEEEGVHPNDEGYGVMAATWFKALYGTS